MSGLFTRNRLIGLALAALVAIIDQVVKWYVIGPLQLRAQVTRTGQAEDYLVWRFSPLLAEDLQGVAQAIVLLAGFDPFLDEGQAYAD